MKSVSSLLLALFLLTPVFGICQNTDIKEIPFKIAGGKTISVKVSDRGALAAENDKIKITAASVLIGPSRQNSKAPALIWSFGFKSKTNDAIAKITVENVFPSDPAILLIKDDHPKLKNGSWIGQIENGDPTGSSNAWLEAKKYSAFIFRFTVFYKNGTQAALDQLALFSEDDKQFFLRNAQQLKNAK